MKIQPQVADKLSAWAEEFYNPELPYHNWGHAQEVMDASLLLVNMGIIAATPEEAKKKLEERAKAEEDADTTYFDSRWTRRVNRKILQIAAAWHDAGHDHDERHEFESPEAYSVHLMRERLKGQLPQHQLNDIEETILGTRLDKRRKTMEAKALHFADVSNMAHPFESFFDHTTRLWQEHGRPDWEQWRFRALNTIGSTATGAFLELPQIGVVGDIFRYPARQNMARLRNQAEPTE